jgi:hypothetical protein
LTTAEKEVLHSPFSDKSEFYWAEREHENQLLDIASCRIKAKIIIINNEKKPLPQMRYA